MDWYENLYTWSEDAEIWLGLNIDYMDAVEAFGYDVYNHLTDIIADFDSAVTALEDWIDDLKTNNLSILKDFINDYNAYVADIDAVYQEMTYWRDGLINYATNLQAQISSLQAAVLSLPPVPTISFTPLDPFDPFDPFDPLYPIDPFHPFHPFNLFNPSDPNQLLSMQFHLQ